MVRYVKISYKMFVKEHVNLINMLESVSKILNKEAKEQKAELKKVIRNINKNK